MTQMLWIQHCLMMEDVSLLLSVYGLRISLFSTQVYKVRESCSNSTDWEDLPNSKVALWPVTVLENFRANLQAPQLKMRMKAPLGCLHNNAFSALVRSWSHCTILSNEKQKYRSINEIQKEKANTLMVLYIPNWERKGMKTQMKYGRTCSFIQQNLQAYLII